MKIKLNVAKPRPSGMEELVNFLIFISIFRTEIPAHWDLKRQRLLILTRIVVKVLKQGMYMSPLKKEQKEQPICSFLFREYHFCLQGVPPKLPPVKCRFYGIFCTDYKCIINAVKERGKNVRNEYDGSRRTKEGLRLPIGKYILNVLQMSISQLCRRCEEFTLSY